MNATAARSLAPRNEVAHGRLVLVVDDSHAQRRLVAASVSRWGYRVIEADSGHSALEICKEHPVEMILSDWMMPGMSGLELCQAFRQLPRDSYGYFILLTSRKSKQEVAQGLEVGADDFLGKPVNLNELRARLTAGERVLRMEDELQSKNHILEAALVRVQDLNEALERDLEDARQLQQSLVRERDLRFGKAEAALLLRPSGHVGGDLVGVIDPGGDEVGFFAIDVSGHGIASALMTARLAAYLSGAVPGQNLALERAADGSTRLRPPAEVAAALNRIVLEEVRTDHYFTLALAWLRPETGELAMIQAGHPHPAIQRASGEIEFLGDGGLPVGLIGDAAFEAFRTRLFPGDRLLICSDGITECADRSGALLDDEGLARLMARHRELAGQAFFDAVTWDLEARKGSGDFNDDISAVLVDYARG